MNLFELFVKIGVDDQASSKIGNITKKLGGGLKTAAKVSAAAVGALSVGAAALGKTMSKNISETAQYADNIDKMSQKMGLSAQAYQEWDFIMQHSGTSIESLQAGMKTLANAVDSGNDAFSRLGITQEQIATLNQEELFAKTIEQLQQVDNETERTYLAGQLLGRGATELGALLNTSAEDTEKMRQQVHELGGVMSDSAVKAGAAFQDSLQNLGVATDSLSRNLSGNFLPSVTSMMDGLSALITGDESGFALIEKGVDDFVKNLNDKLPKFVETGMKIIQSLATSVVENLPILVEKSIPIVEELANGIIKLLPKMLDSGSKIIQKILEGIGKDPDRIVDTVFEVIDILIDAIVDNLPQILSTGVLLLGKFALGIIQAIPDLVRRIPEIINAIKSEFSNHSGEFSNIGNEIVNGIWTGISNAWSSFKAKVSSFFSNIVSSVKGELEIASPSKVFKRIGGFMAEGLGVGWDDEIGDIQDDINGSLDFGGGSVSLSSVNGGVGGRPINITQNIYAQKKSAAQLMQEARWQAQMGVLAVV